MPRGLLFSPKHVCFWFCPYKSESECLTRTTNRHCQNHSRNFVSSEVNHASQLAPAEQQTLSRRCLSQLSCSQSVHKLSLWMKTSPGLAEDPEWRRTQKSQTSPEAGSLKVTCDPTGSGPTGHKRSGREWSNF